MQGQTFCHFELYLSYRVNVVKVPLKFTHATATYYSLSKVDSHRNLIYYPTPRRATQCSRGDGACRFQVPFIEFDLICPRSRSGMLP